MSPWRLSFWEHGHHEGYHFLTRPVDNTTRRFYFQDVLQHGRDVLHGVQDVLHGVLLGQHDAMLGQHDAMHGQHDAMHGQHDAMHGQNMLLFEDAVPDQSPCEQEGSLNNVSPQRTQKPHKITPPHHNTPHATTHHAHTSHAHTSTSMHVYADSQRHTVVVVCGGCDEARGVCNMTDMGGEGGWVLSVAHAYCV